MLELRRTGIPKPALLLFVLNKRPLFTPLTNQFNISDLVEWKQGYFGQVEFLNGS